MKKTDFEDYINYCISNMQGDYIELVSGNIHRHLGEYPGCNHRMPSCCAAMRSLMRGTDEILYEPPKRNGATVNIRYYKKNHI